MSKLEAINVTAIRISDVDRLDPIVVVFENYAAGKGHVIITCYGEAWTAWWGAMDSQTVQQFFLDCDADYLTKRLMGAQFQSRSKGHEKYLFRIIQAVKAGLRTS